MLRFTLVNKMDKVKNWHPIWTPKNHKDSHVKNSKKNNDYRDFVLTRFYGTPESDGQAKDSIEQDEAWNTLVNVCFTPDQRLSPEQQAIVANDYGMSDKRLLIQVRGALVPYLMQMMRIDINVVAADPRAQQVVIQNMDAVKQWLFR